MDAYFGEGGINYNIIRTSIHSSDFGSGSYTYVEEGDKDLSTFSIQKDKEFRIPMIKQALGLIGRAQFFTPVPGVHLHLWKSNNDMLQGVNYYQNTMTFGQFILLNSLRPTRQKVYLFGD